MSVQVGADPCAFRLQRTLTLDPTGLASGSGETRIASSCCSYSCTDRSAHPTESGLCLSCAPARSSSPPPTPFVAAAVSKDVFSAFQIAHELPCSPGSVFRNQDTVIDRSSSEDACASTPVPQVSRLGGALSTPMERGSVGAADSEATQQPVFQRQASACLGGTGSCPAHGVKAVCGKRNKMEDMYAVQPNFCDIPLSPTADEPLQNKLPVRIAVQLENADHSPTCSAPLSPSNGQPGPAAGAPVEAAAAVGKGATGPAVIEPVANPCMTMPDTGGTSDTLHFFGVYDGHGGCQAAEHCARRLHHHLSQSIATACGVLITDGNQLLQAPEADASQVDWSISSSLMQSVAKLACLNLSGPHEASAGGSPMHTPHSRPDSRDKDALDAQMEPQEKGVLPGHPHSQAGMPAVHPHSQEQEISPEHLYPQEKGVSVAHQRLLAKTSVDSDSSVSSTAPDDHSLYPLPENDAMYDGDSSGSSGSDRSDGGISVTGLLEEALKQAFVKTDAEFANDGCAAMVGSTALVALVGTRKVWLANCGDSRAVLCRAGKAIQLTDDHKPEREDEAERVEKAGGQVLYWNGHRVMGVLAMSRAIGDHGLRPYIIPEPEVSVWCRTDDDDFLLLASDGLWDVMANQEATNLCIRCIKRAREKGASRNAAVRIAASVLTKAAIDRGSKDNVTVVIVDLRSERPGVPGQSTEVPEAARAAAGDVVGVGSATGS